MVFEKIAGMTLSGPYSQFLMQRPHDAITEECQAMCYQSGNCLAFSVGKETRYTFIIQMTLLFG